MKKYIGDGLSGKKVVVIGGTSGIGLATSLLAAANGASVVVVSSTQKKVNEALSAMPEGITGFIADVGDEKQTELLFKKIGEFDHLIFTAGDKLSFKELSELDIEEAKKSFTIRFWGAIIAAKYANPMIRKNGSIILTTGALGRKPREGTSVVAAMASAIEGLTRALAIELAPIRVNTVCAGTVRTNLFENISHTEREELYNKIGSKLLTGRIGNANEIAEAYLYLMRASFTTGQIVVADGGSLLV